jgi:hypothetical protein
LREYDGVDGEKMCRDEGKRDGDRVCWLSSGKGMISDETGDLGDGV